MANPVVAIGLDAADPILIEEWMAAGHLPTLSRLRAEGAYGRVENRVDLVGKSAKFSATEPSWVIFATGCKPDRTGYWDIIEYDPDAYAVKSVFATRGYDYKGVPPFMALGDDYKVAVFDVPLLEPNKGVNGPQIMGWGGHFTANVNQSIPENLLAEMNQRHGVCRVLGKDHGNFWDPNYGVWLERELSNSITKRRDIICDLMAQGQPDLMLGAFLESHSAGHDFLHNSSKTHPIHAAMKAKSGDRQPLIDTFKKLDQAIAGIIKAAPENASIVVFSVHGMGDNGTDLLSMTILPEIMYRYNFPGKIGIAAGGPLDEPVTDPVRKSWTTNVWSQRYEPNDVKRKLRPYMPSSMLKSDPEDDLCSPYEGTNESLCWMPATWYRRMWPKMRAFSMPTFWEGRIRLNLKGRDAHGLVEREDYDKVCDEITGFLMELTNPRTGNSLVDTVTRTRHSAADNDPGLPTSDLLISWQECAVDVVEGPGIGRIGPLPFYRSGGHRPRGFMVAKGEKVPAGTTIKDAEVIDLAPTILSLMEARDKAPAPLDGKALF